MSIDAKPWPGGGGAASVPDATETTAGKIRIATSAEATTGTDDTIAMTPLTVKERIDAAVTGGVEYKGTFNATAGTPSLLNAEKGDLYIIDTLGTIYGQTWAVGDHLLINEDMGGSITNSKIDKVDNTDAVTSVNTFTGPVVLSADDLEGDHVGVNYTGLATDTIDVHLSGIDTALGSVGGNQLVRADIKNTSFNADRNSFYRIGTDALTMTMPSSGLSEGDLIGVYAVSSNEFDLTVSGNLVTINASSVSSTTIKVNKRSIMLWVYDASTSRWVQTSDSLDTGSSSDAGIFKVATNAEAEAATIVDKVLVPGLMPYVDLSTLDNDLSADDFPADHTGVNYTGLATDTIDVHLSGIDTALASAGGLSAVVDDTTPQLGGPLDVNGQAITSASNGDVTINPDGTGDISIGADIIPDADATHTIGDEDNRFISIYSDVNGAVRFKAKNDHGSAISKGQVVYIKGVSGTVPTVGLAQANSASTMPAFGLALTAANDQADVEIVTFGNLTDYNTTTYSLSANDTVYVSSATAGALTNSAPTGEANLIQNIGRVVRADASAGIIKVGGAGRSAATPNLDSGKIFLGNGSNQSVSTALSAINLTSFNDDLSYQPLNTGLTSISGLTTSADKMIYTTASDTYAVADLTSAGRALLDDADATAQRTTLGLGTAATSNTGDFLASTAGLDGLSDVAITLASAGEVLKYDGANWVDAQLASTELSDSADLARLASPALTGTPTAPTATAGDSSLQIATTAFVAGEISASTGSDHDPSIVILSTTSYNMQSLVTGGGLSASDVKNLHIWYGASNTSTFTVTLPLVADIISGLTSVNGGAGDTFEIYIGRGVGGDITINASDGIDLLGDGSVSYSTTHTLKPSQFLKVIGARFSSSRYILEAPSVQELDGLSDVVITLASAGEVLKYDGANWVDAQLASTELSDSADLARLASPALTGTPTTTTATQGDNSTRIASTAYVDTAVAGAGGGATDLDGLSDVAITLASTGEILRYDGANWVDAPLSIVDDPSPQLGGDLDLNGHGISSHLVPSATLDIGTASAEWRNLYLRDNGKILFGNDQDVELIHDPDDGLILDLGVADGTHDPQFELKSQSDGLFGPRLTFTADSASPASFDRIGQLRFQGRDSAGNLQDYAYIYGQVQDPTSGAEAGKITLTAYPSSANTRGLHVEGIAGNVLGAKVNIDHNGTDYGLHLNNTLVTSTANELNLLDGGATVGASVTILDTDGVILNDGGTTKLIPASDFKTYVGGGGGGGFSYSAITADPAPAVKDTHYSCTGTFTITLPAVSGTTAGDQIRVKNIGTGTVTIDGASSETVDGATTFAMDVQWSAITLVSNGSTGWEII